MEQASIQEKVDEFMNKRGWKKRVIYTKNSGEFTSSIFHNEDTDILVSGLTHGNNSILTQEHFGVKEALLEKEHSFLSTIARYATDLDAASIAMQDPKESVWGIVCEMSDEAHSARGVDYVKLSLIEKVASFLFLKEKHENREQQASNGSSFLFKMLTEGKSPE
jgi:hypothetical protein